MHINNNSHTQICEEQEREILLKKKTRFAIERVRSYSIEIEIVRKEEEGEDEKLPIKWKR